MTYSISSGFRPIDSMYSKMMGGAGFDGGIHDGQPLRVDHVRWNEARDFRSGQELDFKIQQE